MANMAAVDMWWERHDDERHDETPSAEEPSFDPVYEGEREATRMNPVMRRAAKGQSR